MCPSAMFVVPRTWLVLEWLLVRVYSRRLSAMQELLSPAVSPLVVLMIPMKLPESFIRRFELSIPGLWETRLLMVLVTVCGLVFICLTTESRPCLLELSSVPSRRIGLMEFVLVLAVILTDVRSVLRVAMVTPLSSTLTILFGRCWYSWMTLVAWGRCFRG